jgi:hypothetical protein
LLAVRVVVAASQDVAASALLRVGVAVFCRADVSIVAVGVFATAARCEEVGALIWARYLFQAGPVGTADVRGAVVSVVTFTVEVTALGVRRVGTSFRIALVDRAQVAVIAVGVVVARLEPAGAPVAELVERAVVVVEAAAFDRYGEASACVAEVCGAGVSIVTVLDSKTVAARRVVLAAHEGQAGVGGAGVLVCTQGVRGGVHAADQGAALIGGAVHRVIALRVNGGVGASRDIAALVEGAEDPIVAEVITD